uniref:Uncharacterized protein n=1 Tax=Glossina brevipalpis TaxID=37001 RepID=A0A1A9X153_9MUSC
MRFLVIWALIMMTAINFCAGIEPKSLKEKLNSLQLQTPKTLNNRVTRQSSLNDYYGYNVDYPNYPYNNYDNYRYTNDYNRRNTRGSYGVYGNYGQNRRGGWNGGAGFSLYI